MIAGYEIILNCTAVNDPQSPNQVEFTWYYNDKNITDSIETRSNKDTYVSQLDIQQLDSDKHGGQYLCVAYNNPSDNETSTTTLIIES